MLEAHDVSVFYGRHQALEGASIRVDTNEIVVILGANGAGKSTLLSAIAGLTPAARGSAIIMNGTDITHSPPHEIVEFGIALVPEDRAVFADLTVNENLLLGARPARARAFEAANLDKVLSLFPKLAERRNQAVRTMSGGERQMVAIGRAMMSHPTILMLDEPSLGLSPLLSSELFRSLGRIKEEDVGILLVEQNVKQSLAIADRGYLLDNGHISGADTAEALARDEQVIKTYLGGVGAEEKKPAPATVVEALAASVAITAGNRGTARTRIEEALPLSISELVEGAAFTQSEHVRSQRSQAPAAPPAPKAPPESNGGGPAPPTERPARPEMDELQKMLAGMEQAAARALGGEKG